MADRAAKTEGSSKEVFELDKDERWQARLAEARARREVALREKAAAGSPRKRRKPWEEEGQGSFDKDVFEPIEPILQPRDSDRKDFSDRLDTLKKPKDALAKSEAPVVESTPRAGGNGAPEKSANESLLVPRPKAPVTKIADRYISALSPDFKPSRPYVPEPEEPEFVSPVVRSRPPRHPEKNIEAPIVEQGESASDPQVDQQTDQPKRRGIPVLLVAGVCLLAFMPFTTTTPPIEKGPFAEAASAEFGLEPAFGITSPMNAFPRLTTPGEWTPTVSTAPRGPLAATDQTPADLPSAVSPFQVIEIGPTVVGSLGWTDVTSAPRAAATPKLSTPAPDVLTGAAEPEVRTASASAATPVPAPRPTAQNALRVAMFYPGSFATAEASDLADLVRGRGHELSTLKSVDFSVSGTNIRFYHSEDRPEAERLAQLVGGRLRDFTAFRPSPARGTVEIWLAGE